MQVQIRQPNSAKLNEVLSTIEWRLSHLEDNIHPPYTYESLGILSPNDIKYLQWLGCDVSENDRYYKISWENKQLRPIV